MQELRLIAVSEDGAYLVLASTGRGTRFMLPVDDRLRAAVRGQFSRLGHYEIEVENPLRPKEIQARIRSGETAEAIAEISGIPIDRVRWFEGPVLQERQYMAQQAQRAVVRRQGDSAPARSLGEVVTDRIGPSQQENGEAGWDSWKMTDSTWRVRLHFQEAGHERSAHWSYDPRRRSVAPLDDEAVRFSAPAEEAASGAPSEDNVSLLAPRRPSAAPRRFAEPEQEKGGAAAGRSTRPAPRSSPPEPEIPEEAPVREEAPASRPKDKERPAARRTSIRQSPPPGPPFPADSPSVMPSGPETNTPEPAEPAGPPPAAAEPPEAPDSSEPPEAPPAPAAETAKPRGKREPVTAATAGTANAQPKRQQQRPKGRARRASVPSWDEIMFGSRKPD